MRRSGTSPWKRKINQISTERKNKLRTLIKQGLGYNNWHNLSWTHNTEIPVLYNSLSWKNSAHDVLDPGLIPHFHDTHSELSGPQTNRKIQRDWGPIASPLKVSVPSPPVMDTNSQQKSHPTNMAISTMEYTSYNTHMSMITVTKTHVHVCSFKRLFPSLFSEVFVVWSINLTITLLFYCTASWCWPCSYFCVIAIVCDILLLSLWPLLYFMFLDCLPGFH